MNQEDYIKQEYERAKKNLYKKQGSGDARFQREKRTHSYC